MITTISTIFVSIGIALIVPMLFAICHDLKDGFNAMIIERLPFIIIGLLLITTAIIINFL